MLCVGRCISDCALLLILPSAPTHVNYRRCWFALPQLGTFPDSKAKAVVDWLKDPLTTHENNGAFLCT